MYYAQAWRTPIYKTNRLIKTEGPGPKVVLLSRVCYKTFKSLRTVQWWRDIIFDIIEFRKWFLRPFSIQEGIFTTVPRPVTFMPLCKSFLLLNQETDFYRPTSTSTWIIKMRSVGQSQPQPERYSMHKSSRHDLVPHHEEETNGALNNEYWCLYTFGYLDHTGYK